MSYSPNFIFRVLPQTAVSALSVSHVVARETELDVGMDVSSLPSDWCAGDRRQVLGVVTVAASLSLPSLSLPEV